MSRQARWTWIVVLAAFAPTVATLRAQDSPTPNTLRAGVGATYVPPAATLDRNASPDAFLRRANGFEQQHRWQQAVEVYERAIRLFPHEDSLRQRWQEAERRYSLTRRYHDSSYLNHLLLMPEADAIELYREVVRKIQSHYVEPVELDRLIDSGYTNLRLALSEPLFAEKYLGPDSAAVVTNTQLALAQQSRDRVSTLGDATDEVLRAARICQQSGFPTSSPVILEFLSAACESLDPYSTHLSPNRLGDLYSMIDGSFVGLGIEVRGEDDSLVIVHVLPDSPAEQFQLHEDDRIVEIDGRTLVGLAPEEAANLLQGAEETTVRLKVQRAGNDSIDVTVPRRAVTVHSIPCAELVDHAQGIGYIRLIAFQKMTIREMEVAVNQLLQRGMKALVIDLRGNPGGLLDVAVACANHFIGEGVIVSTKGRAWGQSWSHYSRPMAVWRFPLAVLVDGESASASEIFAGAVQDHRRGWIVGTRTYGKGSVQSIFPLRSAGTGLRLTTARFYSPKGRAYDQAGVIPDAVIERPLGPLGQESPIPRSLDIEQDIQLRQAVRILQNK